MSQKIDFDSPTHEVTALKFKPVGVQVEIDGEIIGILDMAEFHHLKGDKLTDSQLEAVCDNARRFGARLKAARSLSAQSYTEKGLVQKLRQKGIDGDAAKEAAEYYTTRGYINDDDFAKNKAVALHSRKNYGRRRIYSELLSLGVTADTAKAVLDGLPPDREALDRALIRRKVGDLTDRKEKERQYRHFMGQGFSGEDIRSALKGDIEEEYYDD